MTESTATVTLPFLGEDVEQATISRWLASPGDSVELGAPLLEVATDKVDTEIPSPHTGVLLEIFAGEGEAVDVGASLATIDIATGPTTSALSPDAEQPTLVESAESATQFTVEPNDAGHRANDSASALVGSDPDVVCTASPDLPSTGSDTTVQRLPRIRQTIARRMMESLHTSAQLTSVVEVDVSRVAVLRDVHKQSFLERTGTKLSFLPFFAKATIEALHSHPVLTSTVNADCTEVTYHHRINLGIAVDGPKGLMVPVIRNADGLSVTELALAIANLADQVRNATVEPDTLTGATFTITNTGSRGALFDTPILNQPQSGILGTGLVVERVVPTRDVKGGLAIAVRSMVYLSATYDHRVVDGADAARFLASIKQRLESGFSADELMAANS
jgi:2-oxoglutarate dehydrogenase E2 component (dihydrolipoamide succinyltransferase)